MKPSRTRRYSRHATTTHETDAPQHERRKESRFFGPSSHEPFFRASPILQRAPDMAPEEKQEEKAVARVAMPECEKKEEKVDKAPLPDEKKEEKVHKKGESGVAGAQTARYVEGIGSKGQPLASREQHFFGERLGYDLRSVRIHTGEEAAASARDARARAYTYGPHVVFNESEYAPECHSGRELLAHELAHVVQQTAPPEHAASDAEASGGF